jgi:hypothetical protein
MVCGNAYPPVSLAILRLFFGYSLTHNVGATDSRQSELRVRYKGSSRSHTEQDRAVQEHTAVSGTLGRS